MEDSTVFVIIISIIAFTIIAVTLISSHYEHKCNKGSHEWDEPFAKTFIKNTEGHEYIKYRCRCKKCGKIKSFT